MAVGLDLNNNLVKVVDVDNFHPGDGNKADITAHLESFNVGMTYEDVLNYKVDPEAHGTYTRDQINLAIKLAMFENIESSDNKLVDYEIAAKAIFPLMVGPYSEVLTNFKNPSILYGYKVVGAEHQYDGEPNNHIGYVYIVRVENVYSWHIMAVGLDLNNNLVKVVDVDNFHPSDGNKADITAHLETFEAGMTYEDVLNYKIDPEAHGTYTREQINLAIYIAMSESINDSKVKYEIAAKSIFNTMISTKSEIITKFNDNSILFGYKVTGLVNYDTNPYDSTQGLIGYAYVIKSNNLEIMVGITNDNKVKTIYCFGDKQNVDSFAGKNKAEIEALEDSEIKTLVLKVFNELGGNK